LRAKPVSVSSVAANGNLVDPGFSTSSMLSVDHGFTQFGCVLLQIDVGTSDGALLSFKVLAQNLTGLGLNQLSFSSTARAVRDHRRGGPQGRQRGHGGRQPRRRDHLADAPEFFQITAGDWFLDGSASTSPSTCRTPTHASRSPPSRPCPSRAPARRCWPGLGMMAFFARRRGH
jgi:hypothetical protein